MAEQKRRVKPNPKHRYTKAQIELLAWLRMVNIPGRSNASIHWSDMKHPTRGRTERVLLRERCIQLMTRNKYGFHKIRLLKKGKEVLQQHAKEALESL